MKEPKCDVCGKTGEPGEPLHLFVCGETLSMCTDCAAKHLRLAKDNTEDRDYRCVACSQDRSDNDFSITNGETVCLSCLTTMSAPDIDSTERGILEDQQRLEALAKSPGIDPIEREAILALLDFNSTDRTAWERRKQEMKQTIEEWEARSEKEDLPPELLEILAQARQLLDRDERKTPNR